MCCCWRGCFCGAGASVSAQFGWINLRWQGEIVSPSVAGERAGTRERGSGNLSPCAGKRRWGKTTCGLASSARTGLTRRCTAPQLVRGRVGGCAPSGCRLNPTGPLRAARGLHRSGGAGAHGQTSAAPRAAGHLPPRTLPPYAEQRLNRRVHPKIFYRLPRRTARL